MHTATQLRNAMPDIAANIRFSRSLKKAAVIATGLDAGRTLVVTSAVEANLDYHLVQVFDCEPGLFRHRLPHEHNVLELRPSKWCRLEHVVREFLAGADLDRLLAVAARRE